MPARPTSGLSGLNEAGVPCGPIWSIGQSLQSDVVRELGIVKQVQHDLAGSIPLIGPAIDMSAHSADHPPPATASGPAHR